MSAENPFSGGSPEVPEQKVEPVAELAPEAAPDISVEKKEPISSDAVIEKLREKGMGDPETMALVGSWIEQERALVGPTPEDDINFDIKQTQLYIAAGDVDGALDNLDAARNKASQENLTDLYEKIMTMMQQI